MTALSTRRGSGIERHGCSVAHDDGKWYPWETSTSSMETWNMYQLGAK